MTILPDGPVASVIILVGATIEGGVVSRIVTLKVALAALAEKSVAVQDTVVVPRAKVEPDAGEQTTAGSGSTMSVAVAEKVTEAPVGPVASTVMSDGRDGIGGVVSTTVTVKPAVLILPEASVAAHWTRVEPRANVEPERILQDTGTEPSTRSTAPAEYVMIAPAGLVASAVISVGRVKTGPIVSTTVTVEDAEPVLPNTSVAVHVTVVMPRGKVEPERGEQVEERETPRELVAVAVNVVMAPPGPVASSVTGRPIIDTVGGTSVTVTETVLEVTVTGGPELSVTWSSKLHVPIVVSVPVDTRALELVQEKEL